MTVAANIEKEFHITYMKDKVLCTGANIQAKDYAEAYTKFIQEYGELKIIYINEKD